ncbi:MAG TPA: YbaN family protein [Ramlibacter sp.]|nr:YbaN family protein [Ramlibacter sp.]
MTQTQLRPEVRTLSGPVRWLLQALAAVCLVLALVGLVLPVMPTVPFLVVAAWAAARSSPRLHRWLLEHPRFGPSLRDWNEAGIVPRRAKWFCTVMMAGSAVSMPVFIPSRWLALVVLAIACMAAILVWLWRRPETRTTADEP